MYGLYKSNKDSSPYVLIKNNHCWFTNTNELEYTISKLDINEGWIRFWDERSIGTFICKFKSLKNFQIDYPELLI